MNRHRKTATPLLAPLIVLLWAAGCFAFFQLAYPYHFFLKEQNQLFLWSWQYVLTYFARPGWAACLAGDFLTQFFYYLYAGAIILTCSLLLLAATAAKALPVAKHRLYTVMAALSIATAVAALFCHEYYRLASVYALAGGFLAGSAFCRLARHGRWQAVAAVAAGIPLGYWLFGYGVWVASALLLAALLGQRRFLTAALLVVVCPAVMAAGHRLYTTGLYTAATYPGIGKLRAPNFALEHILAVDNEYYFGHYHKVISIVEQTKNPPPEMLFFYNLAQARLGQLPDNLLRFIPNELGTFHSIGPQTPLLTIRNMNELYWLLGDMTYTERAAMMALVFTPGNRNARMVKRLAEVNLRSGDRLAAEKYLRLLSKTFAYRHWAKTAPDPKAGYRPAPRPAADSIRVGDNARRIITQLLDNDPTNTTALDYLLCSDLLLKDIEAFKRDYDRYCTGNRRHSELYQQALMIYLAGTHAPEPEWKRYISRPDVAERFGQYNRQRGNALFKDTYWYYFDTAIIKK